jgi:hypothetical protein
MLTQLSHLSLEAEGRYATASELAFLKDYLQSTSLRINAYRKIQRSEKQIISEIGQRCKTVNPEIFYRGGKDVSKTCERDRVLILRHSATAVLINDTEYLQNRLLYWMKTIVTSFQEQKNAGLTYEIMSQIVSNYLSEDEALLFEPIWEILNSLVQ